MKTRILVVAPYPIRNPIHGGQKRTKAILDRYRELSDDVSFIAIYLKDAYAESYKSDIAISDVSLKKKIFLRPDLTDILTGLALSEIEEIKQSFISYLKKRRPHIIHIEQPYMVEHVANILEEINLKSIIIFGSQNVEFEMKASIYKNQITKDKLSELVTATKDVEYKAVKRADVVLAVSKYDLTLLTKNFRFKPRFVIPNGIEKPVKSVVSYKEWTTIKNNEGVDFLVTFIGSAHPPNLLGFDKLLSKTNVRTTARIIVAGGVCSLIESKYTSNDQLWRNTTLVGVLSKKSLQSLVYKSDIILLPILSGGGSNLKTAEAIVSGKKIVATRYAFRGFEKYLSLPNLYIANSPKAFERAINRALEEDYKQLTVKQKRLTQTVTWPHVLVNVKYIVYLTYILRIAKKLHF